MKRNSLPLLLLTGAFVMGSLSAGCRKAAEEKPVSASPSAAVAVETATAAAGDLQEFIEVTGTLAPRFESDIKSDISGRVAEVLVTEWSRVRNGTPLARIDTSEMDISLRKANAAVAAASAAVETARASGAGARADAATARAGLETARSALAEAKVAAERADREYARLKGLKEAGLATQQALDEGKTASDAARARIGTLETQVASAEAQVAAAEAQVKVADAQAAAAESQAAVAREDVAQVETRLSKAVIRAPFEGTVAERLVSPGEVVGEMQKVLFRVVDNRLLTLTVSVPSGDMAHLKPGQEMTFVTDAFPSRTFSGRVSTINPSVDPLDRSVRVTVQVPNEPEVLKGGLFVTGRIVTGVRTGVVRVPRTALFNWDVPAGRGDLWVVEGDVARLRSVAVGTVTGDLAEISGGLDAGATVVVRGGFNLKDGDRIKAAGGGR